MDKIDTSPEAVAALCLRLVPADCNTVSTSDLARAVDALEALVKEKSDALTIAEVAQREHLKTVGDLNLMRNDRDDLRTRLAAAESSMHHLKGLVNRINRLTQRDQNTEGSDDAVARVCSQLTAAQARVLEWQQAFVDESSKRELAQAREARLREALEKALIVAHFNKLDMMADDIRAALAQSQEQDGGAKFVREARYVVLKWSDIKRAVHPDDWLLHHLNRLCERVSESRKHAGKRPLECVVVESDWPEYEPTWAAIEARMKRQPTAPDAQKGGDK